MTTNLTRLELLTAIGRRILAMALAGSVDVERVVYVTAGKFSEADCRDALKMLHAAELIEYRAGKYHTAA